MKKIEAFILALMIFFVGTNYVYAVCDATETNTLNSLAANVGRSYEIITKELTADETLYDIPGGLTDEEAENFLFKVDFFKIYVTNITEELYVVVTNENTGEKKTFHYSDTDNGTASFEEEVGTEIVNYTIEVYSSDVTNCRDQRLYTLYLTTPMYNTASESSLCTGIEDFYMCHEYLSVAVDFTNFIERTEEYRASHNEEAPEEEVPEEETDGGFLAFVQDHIVWVVVIVVAVVAAGGLITFVVIKKQRSRIV